MVCLIWVLVVTAAPMASASTNGTPERTKIANVLAKRDAFRFRDNLPNTGNRKTNWSKAALPAAVLINFTNKKTAPISPPNISHHQWVKRLDSANTTWVIHGSACSDCSNTLTIFGTTKLIKPTTTATAIISKIIGYTIAPCTFFCMAKRFSV